MLRTILSDIANSAAKHASNGLETGKGIKNRAEDLVHTIQGNVPKLTDLLNVLRVLEYIPGLETETPAQTHYDQSVTILQLGKVSLLLSHNGNEFDSNLLKVEALDVNELNENAGFEKFNKKVLSEPTDADDPGFFLITNKEQVAQVGKNKVNKEIINRLVIGAISVPLLRVPYGKAIIVGLQARPQLTGFIVDIMYDQITSAMNIVSGKKDEKEQTAPTIKPPEA